jgi:hypothetical protein
MEDKISSRDAVPANVRSTFIVDSPSRANHRSMVGNRCEYDLENLDNIRKYT